MSRPDILFGGALIGNAYTSGEQVQELLDQLKSLHIDRIDTAARYPPTNPGVSETLLGDVRAAEQGFTIDTKVQFTGDGSGSLAPAALERSVDDGFGRLKVDRVHVLYCHVPDPTTPLVEQAAGFNQLYRNGRFEKLGVSNFPAELLSQLIAICDENGYVKPSVYQGEYNLVNRGSERALFPLLRQHGIAFNAYSPLAGGFLTGRLTRGEREGTRVAPGNPLGQRLLGLYDKKEMHDAILDLQAIIGPLQISGPEAALRWIFYHSALCNGDGVLLGASKISQIVQNISDISKGPLPAEVVQAMDALWTNVVQREGSLIST